MRRAVAVLLVLAMVFCFAGCSKGGSTTPTYIEDENTNNSGVDLSSFEGRYIKPYLELIASRNFFYQKIDENGDIITFTVIGQDEKVSLSNTASFLKSSDGRIYYIEGTQYFELTSEVVNAIGIAQTFEDIKTVLASFDALVFGMLQLVPMDINVDYELDNHIHEEYMDVENNRGYSFFFVDTTGELDSILEVHSGKSNIAQIKMGTPSPNTISNIYDNYTLIDSATVMQGKEAYSGGDSIQIPVDEQP